MFARELTLILISGIASALIAIAIDGAYLRIQQRAHKFLFVSISFFFVVIFVGLAFRPTVENSSNIRNPLPLAQNNCAHTAEDNEKIFENIIQIEAEAVLTEDMALVQSVYFADAIIRDETADIEWKVRAHYEELFKDIDFRKLVHFDIEVVDQTENRAWVIASDMGKMFFADTLEVVEYETEPGASHYLFQKDDSGCWFILYFGKRAHAKKFP